MHLNHFAVAVVMWTPPMLSAWGGAYTFLFFGIINLTFLPFIYAFYPETKGRSLEEIDVVFAKAYANNVRQFDIWRAIESNMMMHFSGVVCQSRRRGSSSCHHHNYPIFIISFRCPSCRLRKSSRRPDVGVSLETTKWGVVTVLETNLMKKLHNRGKNHS
jgi:hypothetical protein